jgi:hypothetical protein
MFGPSENLNDAEALIPTETVVSDLVDGSSDIAQSNFISDAFIAHCQSRFQVPEAGAY